MLTVNVYTDGSFNHHHRKKTGGWCAIIMLQDGKQVKDHYMIYGAEKFTSLLRMELMGAVRAAEIIKRPYARVLYFTDNKAVVNGFHHKKHRKGNPALWRYWFGFNKLHDEVVVHHVPRAANQWIDKAHKGANQGRKEIESWLDGKEDYLVLRGKAVEDIVRQIPPHLLKS